MAPIQTRTRWILALPPLMALSLFWLLLLIVAPRGVDAAAQKAPPLQQTTVEQPTDVQIEPFSCSQSGDLVASPTNDENFLLFRLGCIEDSSSWIRDGKGLSRRSDSVALGDMDNDGDLDLAVGYSCPGCPPDASSTSGIYLRIYTYGNGIYTLTQEFTATLPISRTSVAWGDMDNDDDLDLVVGLWSKAEGTHLLRNDGSRKLLPWHTSSISTTLDVALGDLNGDASLDIGLLNFGIPSAVYLGTGESDHQNPFTTGSPFWEAPPTTTISNAYATTGNAHDGFAIIDFGDPNGDDELDIVLSFNFSGVGGVADKDLVSVYENIDKTRISTESITFNNSATFVAAKWGNLNGNSIDDELVVAPSGSPTFIYTFPNSERLMPGELSDSVMETLATNKRAIALGDIDNDGTHDIVIANTNAYIDSIYLNNQGQFEAPSLPFTRIGDNSRDVNLGDIDGDGDWDIVTAGWGGTRVFFNQSSTVRAGKNIPLTKYRPDDTSGVTAGTLLTEFTENARSIAWGDVDGDGDLDLAVGRDENLSKPLSDTLYINQDGTFSTVTAINLYNSEHPPRTMDVAWGDINDDGRLELVTRDLRAGSNHDTITLHFFEGHGQSTTLAYSVTDSSNVVGNSNFATGIAWGDVMDDSSPEILAISNAGRTTKNIIIYKYENNENNVGTLIAMPVTISDFLPDIYRGEQFANVIALGDIDNDGQLELSVGNGHGAGYEIANNHIFQLTKGDEGLMVEYLWSSTENDNTSSLAWGDLNGDGYIDLAVGNFTQRNRVYLNNRGALELRASWSSYENDETHGVAWVDVDGDGDLDLTATNIEGSQNKVYVNHNGVLDPVGIPLPTDRGGTYQLVWGDYDNDGDMDLAKARAGSNVPSVVYPNLRNNITSTLAISMHVDGARADFYSASKIYTNGVITIPYTLSSKDGITISQVQAFYSLNGGGNWQTAKGESRNRNNSEVITGDFSTQDDSNNYIFHWSVRENGIMGQSDNVVFRLVALPSFKPQKNGKAGPYMSPVSAQTFPFRVRGTTVRIAPSDHVSMTNVADVRLYQRSPKDDEWETRLVRSASDEQGRLSGRGEITKTDQLLVLVPQPTESLNNQDRFTLTKYISDTKLTLYYTNQIITNSMAMTIGHVVRDLNEQTIAVSESNPLLLFNLDVSLEWDASKDELYLPSLEANLLKASESLYDWTNGQVALGDVRVFQNKERWDTADIQILASNRVRPVARWGGIVMEGVNQPDSQNKWNFTQQFSLTNKHVLSPTHGAIHMGPNWNRYGNAQTIGNDWPRVLAHEMAHYMFFLEDMYLGIEEKGENKDLLVPIPDCKDTAMADPYRYSEFLNQADFDAQDACQKTLAAMGREDPHSEWKILQTIYGLNPPLEEKIDGPEEMPFVFTEILIQPISGTSDSLLEDDMVFLNNAEIVTPTEGIETNFHVNLSLEEISTQLSNGRAYLIQDAKQRIVELGRPVLNAIQARGAEDGDELCIFASEVFGCAELNERQLPTLNVYQSWKPDVKLNIDKTELSIQVMDEVAGPATFTATISADEFYIQTDPTFSILEIEMDEERNSALILLEGDAPHKRAMTGYTLSGGPVNTYCHGDVLASVEGSVVASAPELEDKQKVLLETPLIIPDLPIGTVQIGNAYKVSLNDETINVSDVFSKAGITFQYLGVDMLLSGFPKESLTVYHSKDDLNWKPMRSVTDLTRNFVSAPMTDTGIYLLAAGPALIEVDLGSEESNDQVLEMTGSGLMVPFKTTVNSDYNITVNSSEQSEEKSKATPIQGSPTSFKMKLDIEGRKWLIE